MSEMKRPICSGLVHVYKQRAKRALTHNAIQIIFELRGRLAAGRRRDAQRGKRLSNFNVACAYVCRALLTYREPLIS